MNLETNRRVMKIKRKLSICRKTRKCSYCPMHGGENVGKRSKRGDQKPHYKDKRS